jgi:TRAP-type C4-dicarboxylate transport system permease large subunit
MVIMMELGQITPPVGVNVFVIKGVGQDVPLGTIFKGVLPFILSIVVCLVLLTLFPEIALFLPNLMK